jgi:hypothetical protein
MEFGTFLLLICFSYGIGIFWYDLLPAKLAEKPWRVAAYPFLGIVLCHLLMPAEYHGPAFGTFHLVPLLFGSLVGVIVDVLVTTYRQPAEISAPEMHAGRA